jgi:hypothetical protein
MIPAFGKAGRLCSHFRQFAALGPPLPLEADGDDLHLQLLPEVGRLVVLLQILEQGFEFPRVFPDGLAGPCRSRSTPCFFSRYVIAGAA